MLFYVAVAARDTLTDVSMDTTMSERDVMPSSRDRTHDRSLSYEESIDGAVAMKPPAATTSALVPPDAFKLVSPRLVTALQH